MRPYLENTHHSAGGVARGEGPEFKLQYHKKENTSRLGMVEYA
jgi:hypothetical protein